MGGRKFSRRTGQEWRETVSSFQAAPESWVRRLLPALAFGASWLAPFTFRGWLLRLKALCLRGLIVRASGPEEHRVQNRVLLGK